MKTRYILCVLCAVLSIQAQVYSQTGKDTEAMRFVKGMGLGWNLGNTLDATGDWINKDSISNFERAWGSPLIKAEMFDGLKAAGFKTVRIPVAWSNLMAADYTIHPDLLNRVHEIATWALDRGLYVIVNLHWDGGWMSGFSTDFNKTMKKYLAIWTQVSAKFKDAGDHLILESLNEEAGFDDIWSNQNKFDEQAMASAYGLVNRINQTFVDLVRASGGNNATRYLLIAGYQTDIAKTCDEMFVMPRDPASHSIVSIHYYSPPTFAILEKDASWGKARASWGTTWDISDMHADLDKLRPAFLDKGIPVIMGEYGCPSKGKNPDSVLKYLGEVSGYAWSLGICPVLWDVASPTSHFNRNNGKMRNTKLAEIYKTLTETPR